MTYEDLLQAMLDRVPSNVDKREGSVLYDALAPCAYFLAQQNFQLNNFIDLVFADTAVGEYLDRAVASFGMTRKESVRAERKVVTSGRVAIGSRWGIEGLIYSVTGKTSDTVYQAVCETAGAIGNQYSGVLEPVSNMPGVTAELTDIITAGADEESDESLRERFWQKVRMPATSGNAYHYRLWAMEVPGVGDARVYPLDHGAGTVTVLVVDSGRRPNQNLISAVSEYLETVRPIGASVTVDCPDATAINVTAGIILDGTRSIQDVLSSFKVSLEGYLKDLVFADYRVSYARIGSILLGTDGVADYNDLLLNGAAANVVIAQKAIPVMGTVDVTEVSAVGFI